MDEPTPAPTTESTPQPENRAAEIITDDGKFNRAYLDALPDDLGKHSIFEKYDNPLDMYKGAINAQGLAGKKAEEFWTSEDPTIIAKRNEIRGVPKEAKDYKLSYGEIPEGMPIDESRLDQFKEVAHKLGIPADAAQKLIEWDMQGATEAWGTMKDKEATTMRETQEDLRKTWPGEKYSYNISKVSEAMDYLGLSEFKDDPKYANDATFIKAINDKIVPLIDNDTLIAARQQENYATISDTMTELESRMYAYTGNLNDATYKNMVAQRAQLLQKIARK